MMRPETTMPRPPRPAPPVIANEPDGLFPVGVVPPELLPSGESEDTEDEDTAPGDSGDIPGMEEHTSGVVQRVFLMDAPAEHAGGTGLTVEIPESFTEELRLKQLRGAEEPTAELRLTLLNRARQEVVAGELVEAERSLERADALRPGDPLVAIHRAWLRYVSGELFAAGWEAEMAYAEASGDPEVIRMVEALAEELLNRSLE